MAVSPLLKCACRGKGVFLMVKQENLLGDQKVTPSVWLYMPVPKCECPSSPRLGNLIDLLQILPATSSLMMSTIMPEGVWLAEVSLACSPLETAASS